MNIHTRLTDLLVTGGSHVSHAILLDRSRPSKHFWARERIGLWRGVRDRFSTVSTTVHHTLNAVAHVKSVIMLQHDHRSRSRYVIAFTMEPGRMYLWTLSVCSDSHRILTGRCARSVGIYPSRRRWKRSKCASVRGTRAKRGSRHRSREKQKGVPVTRRTPFMPLPRRVKR